TRGNGGVDIALPANRASVPQQTGNRFDRGNHVLLGQRLVVHFLHLAERDCRQNSTCPGSEVFSREGTLGYGLQVVINVFGSDGVDLSIPILVLEQMLTWQFLAVANNSGDASIGYFNGVLLAA